LQKTEKSPIFNSESFRNFFPSDIDIGNNALLKKKKTNRQVFNIPPILKNAKITPIGQKNEITESTTQTDIDIEMLINVIEDIKPKDETTSTNKRDILSALSKYQRLGPQWLKQEGYADIPGDNYKYVYVQKNTNRRKVIFNSKPLNPLKIIIKSTNNYGKEMKNDKENDYKHFNQSGNDLNYYEEDDYLKDLNVSPSKMNIAYKHWADTQTSKSILISDEEYGQEKLEDLNHMVITH
jgi:hypothetical protein